LPKRLSGTLFALHVMPQLMQSVAGRAIIGSVAADHAPGCSKGGRSFKRQVPDT
jgi:hypothetical protein